MDNELYLILRQLRILQPHNTLEHIGVPEELLKCLPPPTGALPLDAGTVNPIQILNTCAGELNKIKDWAVLRLQGKEHLDFLEEYLKRTYIDDPEENFQPYQINLELAAIGLQAVVTMAVMARDPSSQIIRARECLRRSSVIGDAFGGSRSYSVTDFDSEKTDGLGELCKLLGMKEEEILAKK